MRKRCIVNKKRKKAILILGLILLISLGIGMIYYYLSVTEDEPIDGTYYEMKVVDQTGYLNESYSIKISGDSVLVHRDGKTYEGTVDQENELLKFAGEEYSYSKLQDSLSINSLEKMKYGITQFVQENGESYKYMKSKENK